MISNTTIPEVFYLCHNSTVIDYILQERNVSIDNRDCLSTMTSAYISTESTLNLIENANAEQKEKMIMLSIARSYLVYSIGDCIEQFVKPVIGGIGKITLSYQ